VNVATVAESDVGVNADPSSGVMTLSPLVGCFRLATSNSSTAPLSRNPKIPNCTTLELKEITFCQELAHCAVS